MKVIVEFDEPDKKKKIKRIIAREGLLISGIILAGSLLLFASKHLSDKNSILFRYLPLDYYTVEVLLANVLEELGTIVIIFLYPFYLVVRFITWAIKTLKEK